MEELKPCPFCTSAAVLLKEESTSIHYLPKTAMCDECDAKIEGDNCVELWNTRATDPLIKEMAMALEEIVDDAKSYESRHGKKVSWLKRGEQALQKYREHRGDQ